MVNQEKRANKKKDQQKTPISQRIQITLLRNGSSLPKSKNPSSSKLEKHTEPISLSGIKPSILITEIKEERDIHKKALLDLQEQMRTGARLVDVASIILRTKSASKKDSLIRQWVLVIFKYLLAFILTWLLHYIAIWIMNRELTDEDKAHIYRVFISLIYVLMFSEICFSVVNTKQNYYDPAKRAVAIKDPEIVFYIPKSWKIVSFFSIFIIRYLRETYKYISLPPGSNIFEGILVWLLTCLLMYICSNTKTTFKSTKEESEYIRRELNERVIANKEKFKQYCTDTRIRLRFLLHVLSDLQDEELKQQYYQKMKEIQFEFFEEDRRTQFNTSKVLKRISGFDKEPRRDSRSVFLIFNPAQIIVTSFIIWIPFFLDFLYFTLNLHYSKLTSIPLLILVHLFYLMIPFILVGLSALLNLLYPLRNYSIVKLMLEIVQAYHQMLIMKVPLPLQSKLPLNIYMAVFLSTIMLSKLFLNFLPLKSVISLSNFFFKKEEREEVKFTQKSSAEIKLELKHYQAKVESIFGGTCFIFALIADILIFWFNMWFMVEVKGSSIDITQIFTMYIDRMSIFSAIMILFFSLVFIINIWWVKININKGALGGVNYAEVTVTFLHKFFWCFFWFNIWNIVSFSVEP